MGLTVDQQETQVFDDQGLPLNEAERPAEEEDTAMIPGEVVSEVPATVRAIDMFDVQNFEMIQRWAKAYNCSTLVPQQFQGNANIGNCVIACNMAQRMGADPLQVMQSLYIVHGKPSWSAAFLIACFNTCGRFTPIHYEFDGEGDAMSCRAISMHKATGEVIEGPPVSIQMAKDEGWHGKNGSKWKTMPTLMLRYRAATFLVRTVAPELSLGLKTSDEVEDIQRG